MTLNLKKCALLLPAFLALGYLFSIFDNQAFAQVVRGLFRGAVHVGVVQEKYRYTTAKGNRRVVRFDREVAVVPEEYGELIFVTENPRGSLLWYKNQHGVVRNVQLSADAPQVLIVQEPGLIIDKKPKWPILKFPRD